MKRKKILWLCSWYPNKLEPFNGDFIQRHAQAAALYNDIHVIHLAADTSGNTDKAEKEINKLEGMTEHIVYYKKKPTLIGRLIAYNRWLFFYRQAIRKYIVENGKPDLVHVHVPYKAGLFGIWMKKKYKVPYVLTEHWGIYNDVEVLNYAGRTDTFKKFTKQVFNNAASCISVSNYLAEGVNRLVVQEDFSIIHNVVNTEIFFYKENKPALFRFIHVSNMVPLKNVEGIIRAFKVLQDEGIEAELHMVGNTNDEMVKYAQKISGKKSISFHGEVPYEKVGEMMQQSNCLIVNSNIENSPCVIGEALCCGLPVIATNVGGIPELVDDSNTLLIPAGNDEALAAAMKNMIASYHKYNSKKIAEDAQSKFSYQVIGKKFDEIYSSLLPANN